MIRLRRSADRGRTRLDWLDSAHTFSFADYHDPAHMGFRVLRVLNEDRVAPGGGFPMHGHRDMEILTVVLSGALQHRDSLGNTSVIRPGEIQRMTAGTGITHSEFNASDAAPVHFLQIWIHPARRGLPPGYAQNTIPLEECRGRWCLLASARPDTAVVTLEQDVDVSAAVLTTGEVLAFALRPGRAAWLQVLRGVVQLDAERVTAGDGAAVEDAPEVTVTAEESAELLWFDLP